MNVLLIHGVNTDETATPNPYDSWITAIQNGLLGVNYPSVVIPTRFNYNALFDQYDHGLPVYGVAVAELLASAAWHALATAPQAAVSGAPTPAQPGPGFSSEIQWTAGMVAQWVAENDLRQACRDQLLATIQNTRPDVIFAHSLGSLLCYDLLVNDGRAGELFLQGTLVTFGSQIANPFVKDRMWNGQVEMPPVARWINLYNPHDPVFVASIAVAATKFYQFVPVFGAPFFDVSAHDVTTGSGHPGYLDHPTTDQYLWPLLAGSPMALQIERNLRIAKRTPASPAALAASTSAPDFSALPAVHSSTRPAKFARFAASAPAPHFARTPARRKHHYRYHPPRPGHHLVATARFAPKLETVPATVDLRNLCLPIRNQQAEGACSGFATAAFRETSYAQARAAGLPNTTGAQVYLSPAFLYWQTRTTDGTFPSDSGASIADEFASLQNEGVCPENDLPYNADPTEAPTPATLPQALPYRLPEPLQVNFKDPQALKSVLAGNQTITIGFWVYDSFEEPAANGVVPIPATATEQLRGGHGVLLCGYDDENEWWIIRNQWGPTWGDRGYCYMPYGYEAVWVEAWTGAPTGLQPVPAATPVAALAAAPALRLAGLGAGAPAQSWTIQPKSGPAVIVVQDSTGRVSWVSGGAVDADGSNGQNGNPFAYRADNHGTDTLADAGYPNGSWDDVLVPDPNTGQPLDDGNGNWYSQTTYFWAGQPVATRYVDASAVPYIVVNPLVRMAAAGVVIGCKGRITYRNVSIDAVVADVSGAGTIGEMSIAAANQLNIPSDPRQGGVPDGVLFEFWPGTPAVVNGATYNLIPA